MNILDILDTMVASNVEAAVAANGVRDNVIACADDQHKKNVQQKHDDLFEETTRNNITQVNGNASPNNINIKRSKRSGNDFASCCDKLYVHITVVDDDNVKDVHEEWVGSYMLQSQMSNADLLVYERQITEKRYLYIHRHHKLSCFQN